LQEVSGDAQSALGVVMVSTLNAVRQSRRRHSHSHSQESRPKKPSHLRCVCRDRDVEEEIDERDEALMEGEGLAESEARGRES